MNNTTGRTAMLRAVSLLCAISVVLSLQCAAKSVSASYHYTQKQIQHGDLDFHKQMRVNEYLNAFTQFGIDVKEGRDVAVQLDPFTSLQPAHLNKNFIQLAIKTRKATTEEKSAPISLCIVLDVSGSMTSDNKAVDAIAALKNAVAELGNGDEFALIVFSSSASRYIPATVISPESRATINERIGALTAGGGTDIEAGLVEGYREMTAFANKGFRRLVLLTDGQSDVNRFSPDSIAAAAHVPFNSNIKISTIGLGIDVKQSVLRRIAEEGKGDFYFAENSSTLTEILREELRSMLVPVVENAVLRIDVAPGVTVTEWYGIPDSLRERKSIPVSLGTLNVNDWRIIIIGIMGDSAHWNSCPVQATLRYEKYGSSEAKELSARAELPMQTAVTQAPSVNVYVARNSVLFANAQCLVKIGQLAEKSRFSEALDIIDVQIGNCNAVLGFGDRDEMEKELSSLQKVRQIVERRLQETGMQPRPVAGIQTTPVDTSSGKIPGKSDKLAHILKAGANLVIDALPGPWKTVAEIFMILIN